MPARNRYAKYVLWLHVVVAEVFAVMLLVLAGKFSEWVDWWTFDPTMTKMLGAALLAFGVGSGLAARDPLKYRIVIQMEIVYTAASAVVLLYRLVHANSTTPEFAWVPFAAFTVFFVLFCVMYPSAASAEGQDASAAEASPADS
jgi:hypothetical protein